MYIDIFASAAFLTQTVCLDDTTVKFEIWDTAGQERYHSLAPMYYRGAQAAIVVYDITNQVILYVQQLIIILLLFLKVIHSKPLCVNQLSTVCVLVSLGQFWQGKDMGKRVAATSQSKHCHCSCWQQSRPGQQAFS